MRPGLLTQHTTEDVSVKNQQSPRPLREEDIDTYKPDMTPWVLFSIIGGITLYYSFTLFPFWGAVLAGALTFNVLWGALKSELASAKRFYLRQVLRDRIE